MNFLDHTLRFPDIETTHPSGIIAFGGDLSVERLMIAYRNGIFPWFEDGEIITWWCPKFRMVVFPQTYIPTKNHRYLMRRNTFQITFNQAFERVIFHCKTNKRNGQKGTWITEDMEKAYINLHQKGFAKSVEIWDKNLLVGGLYGIDLGHVFCGESMFSMVPNASKVAFLWLIEYLKTNNYRLLDCQVYNEHLALLGAQEIERELFLKYLKAQG